jgi:arylsulfatase A-like enzyme
MATEFKKRIGIIAVVVSICAGTFFLWKRDLGKVEHVIFVTIDTLRPDHVGAYGYPRNVTPFIDSLAQKGVIFENAYSAAPHTAPSHATMFTSLYPFEHNVLRNQEYLDGNIYNLYKAATDAGFEAGAFTSVKFLDGRVGFPKFSSWDIPVGTNKNERQIWFKNASNVIDRAIDWISTKQESSKIFVWLHLYDVHQWGKSIKLPQQYKDAVNAMPTEEHLAFLKQHHNLSTDVFGDSKKAMEGINGYDARLMYVDDELKRLNKYFEDTGRGDNLLWVILSDHGEGLGNHNYLGHGEFLYEEQLRIPLIFSFSDDRIKPRRVSDLVRTVEILPTFVDLFGVTAPADNKMRGFSLVSAMLSGGTSVDDVYSFAERRPKDEISFRKQWLDGEVYSLGNLESKVIKSSHGKDEFYDLKKDPFELNKNSLSTELSHQINDDISALFDPSKRSMNNSNDSSKSSEDIEELKSLGYL